MKEVGRGKEGNVNPERMVTVDMAFLKGAWKFFLPGQFKRIAKELEGRVYDMIFRAK